MLAVDKLKMAKPKKNDPNYFILPTKVELKALQKFDLGCPACGAGIYVAFFIGPVGQGLFARCWHCDFDQNITDYDSW